MELRLIKNENFGNTTCDVYKNIDGDFFMTRKQIGEALEYADPNRSIAKIHDRNAERLSELSAVVNLTTHDGKESQAIVYSAKGIYEICRWSKQPKANDFYDWIYKLLERLRKGELSLINSEYLEVINGYKQIAEDTTSKLAEANAQLSSLGLRVAKLESQGERKKIKPKKERAKPKIKKPNCIYNTKQIAEILGVYSEKGAVGTLAVGAILSMLEIPESEMAIYLKKTIGSKRVQYSEVAVYMVSKWFKENGYPSQVIINSGGKVFQHSIKYKGVPYELRNNLSILGVRKQQ